MRRFDPAGQPLPLDAYVFGNAIGQPVADVKRAWMRAVLQTHGVKPQYTATMNLTRECREAFERINLHLHDLRRECGSRWLDGGVPLHVIRDWLGHTNIAQTSTYLRATLKTQHDAMTTFEERQAALQRLATNVGTGGQIRPQTAATQDETPNETAVGRGSAIM
jgi:Phage integrase family